MTYKFTIPGTLPNLNNYLQAERLSYRHKGKFTTKGNEMKHESQDLIIWAIRSQLKGVKIKEPIELKYIFVEKNFKRDLDNIASYAMKVIQDSLVLSGVIQNDGWKNIIGFECYFEVDPEHPRIEVFIKEVGVK